MHRSLVLAAAALAVLVLTAPAGAASPLPITIRHQVKGCHTWAVAGGAFRASQTIRLARGKTIAITNHDVMPHMLVQLAGPRLTLHAAKMNHMGASTHVTFTRPGTYRLRTVAGEDYPSMQGMKTIGEDNVLRLTVVVP